MRSQIRSFHSSRRDAPAVLNLGHGAVVRCTLFSIPRFPREPFTTAACGEFVSRCRAFVSITTAVYPGAHARGNAPRRAGAGELVRSLARYRPSGASQWTSCGFNAESRQLIVSLASVFVSAKRENESPREAIANGKAKHQSNRCSAAANGEHIYAAAEKCFFLTERL